MRDATLILGGGGFIGQALSAALRRSHSPVAVLSRGIGDGLSPAYVQRRGSVEDSGLLREMLADCASVVYLACVTTPGSSAREPTLEVTGNLIPLARFMEVAQDMEPRRLVFVSTAGALYGNHADGVTEDAVLRPRSFYGAGKVAAESMLHAFAAGSGWRTTILRPTNVYGPGQLPLKGFAIIPTIFQHLLEGRIFEIWGDGSVVRDYLFIDDFCSLIIRMLEAELSGSSVFNIGSGTAVSILDLIGECEAVTGRKLATVLRPPRTVDVARMVPDTSSIRAYGWQPETSLRSGLAQTWQWMSARFRATPGQADPPND